MDDMATTTTNPSSAAAPSGRYLSRAWLFVALAAFGACLALTYDPSFDTPTATARSVLPFVVLPAMVTAFADPWKPQPLLVWAAAITVTLAGWSLLMLQDDRWSILTFALFGLCFAIGPRLGITLAGVVSLVWTAVWLDSDGPSFRMLIPVAAFGVGTVMSLTLRGAGAENAAQADLIAELRATQHGLAASERDKGVLEERARFAGEIHDTIAQGLTSIVLLSRATRRNLEWADGLTQIEAIAEENLQSARRLVAAIGPAQLDSASLAEALADQAATLDGEHVVFETAGTPRALNPTVEATLLRAAQEALLNVRTHAAATEVHVTLSYFDDSVALDIEDNGVGFALGDRADRGTLTGGQGLLALTRRAESLGGSVTIETRQGGGSVVTVQLPAPRA